MSALSCATVRGILPPLAPAQLGDVRQVMVRMPGVVLQMPIERHLRAVLRVDERPRELLGRHAAIDGRPSGVDAVDQPERHVDRQPHVGKRGPGASRRTA